MKQTLQSHTNQQIQPKFSFLISVLPLEGACLPEARRQVRGLKSKKKIVLSFAIMVLFCLSAIQLSAQISGTVYQDLPVNGAALNTYGVKDANELGVEGVTVTVYPGGMSAMTAADGTYTVAGAPDGAVRVEFSWPTLTWLQSSSDAGAQNTSVQFVMAPAPNVNFGVTNPSDYCNANPDLITNSYISGNPLVSGTASSADVLVSFSYNAQGIATQNQYDAFANQIGSTWGLAYQRSSKRVFAGAFLKRHVGLGPLGEGGIYVIDYSSNPTNPSVVPFIDVNSIGINTASVGTGGTVSSRNQSRGLVGDKTAPSLDLQAYPLIGKVGLGDLDISADGQTLWVVSLDNRTLNAIIIDIDSNPATAPTAADVTTYNLPANLCGGAYRPFGIKVDGGDIYVGSVCENALQAFVHRLENNGTFTQVFNIALNYPKGDPFYQCPGVGAWNTWTDVFPSSCNGSNAFVHPQPILSDIEIDADGSFILGFVDRFAHQSGYDNITINNTSEYGISGGDILRVCLVNGVYVLEGSTQCQNNSNNNQGPGGGEFYPFDTFQDPTNSSQTFHAETSLGGLALLPGKGEVAVTSMDPYNTNQDAGGVNWFNNINGTARAPGYLIYEGVNSSSGFFGKAAGLGDIELLCESPPIEIGNLVWEDTNSNGEQDADEAGLAGVTVELYDVAATTLLATAVTDANGNYIFSNDPAGTAFVAGASHVYQLTTLNPNTAYILKVATTNGGDNLTTANGAGGKDIIDSDANIGTGEASVLATDIPFIGANNHTFDFGYSGAPPCPPTRCGEVGVIEN